MNVSAADAEGEWAALVRMIHELNSLETCMAN